MSQTGGARITLAAAIITVIAMFAPSANAQANPYHRVENWAKLPEGRKWGSVSAVSVDAKGNVWAFERCGANSCDGSDLAPILEFDSSGKLVKSFGAGMFVFPHGIYVDKDGNVWATDAQGKGSKGHQVFKFSADGKVLLTLGKAGVAGVGEDTFNSPSSVVTAKNGDIYVADGHGGDTNARIMKFSKGGKFIKTWGKKGAGPSEFAFLHGIALDSQGRVFVADRTNNRIQIFDADGKFLTEWKQFGRPSAVYIDAKDTIYVTDSQSDEKTNPGVKMGIRVGSAKDGVVKEFIPVEASQEKALSAGPGAGVAAEGVAADASGNNVYGGETGTQYLRKYSKK